MAKKALINKQQRQGKFKVREYTRCAAVRPAARRLPQVPALPHLLPRARARGRAAGGDEGVMVKLATHVTDPIGDMLTRIRNANLAYKDDLLVPGLEDERGAPRRS